ncbi:hypothetical protein PS3A_56640 [Pseudomonas sp. 3A(2025)]
MSNKKGPQGPMQLPPSYVTETEYRSSQGSPGGGAGWGSSMWGMPTHSGYAGESPTFDEARVQLHYESVLFEESQLDTIAEEIESVERNIVLPGNATALTRADHQKTAVEALLHRKTVEYQASKERSYAYYGESPLGKGGQEYKNRHIARSAHSPSEVHPHPYTLWESSYRAALAAQTQEKIVQIVTAESQRMHAAFIEAHRLEHAQAVLVHEERLRVEHAQALLRDQEILRVEHAKALLVHEALLREEHAKAVRLAEQKAAEEKARQLAAQKAAEEKARQLAAQKAAEEKARQLAAQKAAEEKARQLAAQKAAEEKARQLAAQKAAEEKARQLAAQKAVEEKARQLAAQKAAEEKARQLAAQKAAEEKARQLAAQKATEEKARQLAEQKEAGEKDQLLRARLIHAMAAVEGSSPGLPNPVGIARTAVSTILNSPAGRAAAVRAVNSLTKAIEGFGRSADELGNDLVRQSTRMLASLRTTFQDYGEFFSGSIPASEVVPQSSPELSQIAAQGGSIDVPGWASLLGSNTIIGSIELASSDVTAAAPVEVRSATFNERNKTWSVAFPGNPGATLIWTPIAPPIDSSTALPGSPLSEAPYIGKPLSPVEPVISPLPAAPPGLQGLITVFPADSGLPPLFTVFNSPYPGATFKGIYSGRYYNPKKAGGPILSLSWVGATVTQEGIALVKLHTGRLDYSAANDVMITRLEKILKGELQITDTDKRYYTHEIRELERYRAIGVLDGPVPQEIKGEVWNNAHAATLEDFKLKDDSGLFYTNEANAAHEKHEQKELEDFQRGLFK